MTNSNVQANVLPAGSVPPAASLEKGAQVLKIVNKEIHEGAERYYLYVQFPDGFTKTFQIKSLEELVAQITKQLRGRYGVESVSYVETPPALEKDTVIKIQVL